MRIEDVYRALWRHKFLIVIGTVLVMAAAWFLASRETKMYEAGTLVRVQQKTTNPTDAYGLLNVNAQLAQTYADIVQTNNIARRISQLQSNVSPGEFSIRGAPVNSLALLWIKARSANPQVAQRAAAAAPTALQDFIRQTGTLNDHIVVVENAGLPSTPVSPNVKTSVLLAFLLGLILNGGLALVKEVVSDRITSVDELERMVGVPVLTTIPFLRFSTRGPAPQQWQASAQVAEPLRSVGPRPTRTKASGV